jgi:hypothetical protein
MKEEIVKSLKVLVVVGGKTDAGVLKALNDPLPVRKIAAAEALAPVANGAHWADVRKLLKDADSSVRVRAALALVNARDKETVPALIDLLAEVPRDQTGEIEELLRQIAGSTAPAVAGAKDDPEARKKLRDVWQDWWKDHKLTADLGGLSKITVTTELLVIAECGPDGTAGNPVAAGGLGGFGGGFDFPPPGLGAKRGPKTDRLVAIDRKGQQLWKIENLEHPVDFQLLPGGHVLIAEFAAKRVTERDHSGKIHLDISNLPGSPINVQRLPNGNTFIALYNTNKTGFVLVEVDKAGKTVANFNNVEGPVAPTRYLQAAFKMADGNLVCLISPNKCIWLDAAGNTTKRLTIPVPNPNITSGLGNIDVTSKGNIIVMQNNAVIEYDGDGKIIWQVNAPGNRATRLAGGNTLVASENTGVIEIDKAGKSVWDYKPPAGYQAMRARTITETISVVRPAVVVPASSPTVQPGKK